MTQEKTLQALHSENERLGLYKDAYAQPEQEPVAWQFMNGSNFRKRRPDDFADLDSDGLPYWKPLYTNPPQRTWVNLTRTQMQDVYFAVLEEHRGGHQMEGQLAFGEALQAKIKEKNT